MITLVGTGHTLDLSSSITKIIDEKKPDIICVELDKKRYNLLLMKNSNSNNINELRKDFPILYKLFARYQNKIAKEFGVNAGDEMLTAIKYAKSHQIQFELIDMNPEELYEKTFNSMSFFEKLKISLIAVSLTFFGWIFIRKKDVNEELKKMQKENGETINKLGKKYPTIKRILLDERNSYMTDNLIRLNDENKKIIAFVGDAHVTGISKLLRSNKIEYETVRLGQILKK